MPAWLTELLVELPWAWPAAAAVLGAVAASVAGTVAARLPHQIGWRERPEPGLTILRPGPRCDSCRTPLGLAALVPVAGWLACRGRCRACGGAVSASYPVVEASSAASSAAVAALWGATPEAVALLSLLWTGLTISWLDLQDFLIPEAITVPLFWGGLLLSPFEPDPASRILGAFAGFAVVWATSVAVGKARGVDAVSGGDVMMAAVAGAWAGFGAMPAFLLAASLGGVAFALLLRLRGQREVPWGPALSGALLLVVATGVRWP